MYRDCTRAGKTFAIACWVVFTILISAVVYDTFTQITTHHYH